MLRFAVDAWRRRTAVCGGEVHEVGGLVVCLTGVPAPWFNATLVADPDPDPDPGDAIDRAMALYPPDLGFGMELLPDLHPQVRAVVEGRGWRTIDVAPVMTLDVASLRTPPMPDGLELIRVTDPVTLDRVAAIDAAAFGGDAGVTRRFLPDAIFHDPSQRVYAGLHDGEMVAAGETSMGDGVLGVFGVATVPEARGRGIGAALTAHMIADRAGEADAAMLEASELGRGVYERLGFRAIMTREVWGPPEDA